MVALKRTRFPLNTAVAMFGSRPPSPPLCGFLSGSRVSSQPSETSHDCVYMTSCDKLSIPRMDWLRSLDQDAWRNERMMCVSWKLCIFDFPPNFWYMWSSWNSVLRRWKYIFLKDVNIWKRSVFAITHCQFYTVNKRSFRKKTTVERPDFWLVV